MFVPVSVHEPVPDLTIDVVPTLSLMAAASVLAPAFDPVRVSVRGFVPPKATAPVLEKFTTAAGVVPEASSVAPLPIVNCRSVAVAVEPAYCSVPPPNTRFAAAFDDWPMLLAEPPLASAATVSVPPESVVVPV